MDWEGEEVVPYDSELQLLRELAYWVLPQLQCHFCGKGFMEFSEAQAQGFGHRRHRKLKVVLTFHHLDENRANNDILTNIKASHPPCHKRHHNEERNKRP